jgi:oxygen-dependent protoporphyrinogen oxidase
LAERTGDAARADRVIVIGGGLSGLATAHRIQERSGALRRSVELTLLEAKERLGGVIATERCDGFTLEGGPDSFITNKPWGLDLCTRLGLGGRLIETEPGRRRSFVVRKGRLLPVPEGFVLMKPQRLGPLLTTPILSWRGKIRMLMDLFLPRRDEDGGDESVAGFVRRRFGREALDRLIQPLVAGIYTADPSNLSLKATFSEFPAMEREHRSIIRGALREARARGPKHVARQASGARYGMFVTLDEGMGGLPAALAAALPGGCVRLNTAVRRIHRNEPASPWLVELLDGPPLEADAVVLTTEAHAAARLIDAQDPALALQLRAIPYASSVIVNVAYHRDQVQHPLDGFGAVVPAIEGRPILAVSFLSIKFPNRAPAGTVLLRVFIGGATRPELFDLDDAAIGAMVRHELGELIGATGEPLFLRIGRHPRSMPQYILGHLDRVAAIRLKLARHPRLYLTGIAYDGVGIPDCIHAAETTAETLLAALANLAASAA